jgi:predicted GIY-YIG superfamily endonuclease
MSQLLLFPDPRPLVERLGVQFFREAPAGPGVYLMRDQSDSVLYVGKAKNLRQRLANYRIANPDRLRRRHLRLLRAVVRIDLERCLDEADALSREAHLLRSLRPPFNRAGTWPGPPRFLAWRSTEAGLEFLVSEAVEPGLSFRGPLGFAAYHLRAALFRSLWFALRPDNGWEAMPAGWFRVRRNEALVFSFTGVHAMDVESALSHLARFASGEPELFPNWLEQRTTARAHVFERAVLELDLQVIREAITKTVRSPTFG